MWSIQFYEGDAAIAALVPKANRLADEAKSPLTFHRLSVPLTWFRHFNSAQDGQDFGSKRGRNFYGNRSWLDSMTVVTVESGPEIRALVALANWRVQVKGSPSPLLLTTFCADSVQVFYQDILSHPSDQGETLPLLLDALQKWAFDRSSLLFLGYIPDGSGTLPYLAKASQVSRDQGHWGGHTINRSRPGIYPWNIDPLVKALRAIEPKMTQIPGASERIQKLMSDLEAQTSALLVFQATRTGFETELHSILADLPKTDENEAHRTEVRTALDSHPIIYPFLALPSSREEYQANLSSSKRYYFRRYLKKFQEAGGSFESLPPESITPKDIQDYLDLHTERWGADSISVNERTLDFHRELTLKMAGEGVFRLFFAKLGEERIVAHACFDIHGRREYFFSGRKAAYEELRAGKLMVMETVLDAIDHGFKVYDFGYGGDEYKADFTRTSHNANCYFFSAHSVELDKIFPKYEWMKIDFGH